MLTKRSWLDVLIIFGIVAMVSLNTYRITTALEKKKAPIIPVEEMSILSESEKSEIEWTRHIVETTSFNDYLINKQIWDGSYPDMIGEYAIEVDWAEKWKESIGQALLYGSLTNKPPAVVILLRDGKTEQVEKYLYRCAISCAKANVVMFIYDCKKGEFYE